MTTMRFTDEQRRAIETVDRGVIVSAAAGSGKTAVLAERCVYLVCDAPEPYRCDIDQLLVLTFTDAAATEMRERIIDRLRVRLERTPDDARLRDQVARAGAAHISTIHAFCFWLIRRRFADARVDPMVGVLDDREAAVLRREVLDEVFERRYARVIRSEAPLDQATIARLVDEAVADRATIPAGSTGQQDDAPGAGNSFQRLVNVYGLGKDEDIAKFLLRLDDFLSSIPDREEWLTDAVRAVTDQPWRYVLAHLARLGLELRRQKTHCERLSNSWRNVPDTDPYLKGVHLYAAALNQWIDALRFVGGATEDALFRRETLDASDIERACREFDEVRESISTFEFARIPPKFPGKGEDPDSELRRKEAHNDLRDNVCKKRLYHEFATRTAAQLLADVRATAPFVHTLVGLARELADAYQARKQKSAVLDFADFERLAFDLLHVAGHPEQPSTVARELQDRFVHVLVDEFQDINPLQQSILRLVSRETDSSRTANLFVVGDVKQSIYRFRQAEAGLFLRRWREFHDDREPVRAPRTRGAALSLRRNFRSRGEIIDTVNAVFQRLMIHGVSDILYDSEAQLRLARTDVEDEHSPVELHILERGPVVPVEGDASDDMPVTEPSDSVSEAHWDQPARWLPIEREAYVVGERLHEWIHRPGLLPGGRKLAWSDAAVLVRSHRINAGKIANVLMRLGIPTVFDGGGSLFEAREIRDVRAALEVLDNVQQDIPLASTLRSGVFGERFDEDDLVEIRCLDRTLPFHDCVRRYASGGANASVRERVERALGNIARFREEARRRPLPDVLWSLYESYGFLAYVGGLPHGDLRLANLNALHDLARTFSTFRRQGLHRFLTLLRAMEDADIDVAASADATGEGAVRIMSIHKSKGLQFPVVFVAGLGTAFNLGDRNGRLIFERRARIGLKVVDESRCVEYPSPAHRMAAAEIERATREEEMRLLYVAMTRAQEKLVLLGSYRRGSDDDSAGAVPEFPAELDIVSARSHLEWVTPILRAHEQRGDAPGAHPRPRAFAIRLHDASAISRWQVPQAGDQREKAVLTAVARGDPLPDHEPRAADDPRVARVRERMNYVYPYLALTTQRSAMGAGEFKGRFDYTTNVVEPRDARLRTESGRPQRGMPRHASDAARRGTATHRILQHLDYDAARDAAGVDREIERLVRVQAIETEEAALVDREAIHWIVTTPLAERIRLAGRSYRREFAFITKERPHDLDRSIPDGDDMVLVRGIVDGVLPTDAGLELIDFKTDAVDRAGAADRAEDYRPQMQMYARAMARLWKKPVNACRIVFLAAREIVTLHDRDLGC